MTGTGFGFGEKVSLKYSRGEETREVRGHVKLELLVAGTSTGDYIVGVSTAPSYEDERKLLLRHLSIKLCLLRESRVKHLSKLIHSIFYGGHGFLPFVFAYLVVFQK